MNFGFRQSVRQLGKAIAQERLRPALAPAGPATN